MSSRPPDQLSPLQTLVDRSGRTWAIALSTDGNVYGWEPTRSDWFPFTATGTVTEMSSKQGSVFYRMTSR